MPLRVGIAGYGVVGQRRRHFIDMNPDLRTVAICDRIFGSDGQMNDGVRYYADYRQLLTDDLDIIFVCLPNDIAPQVTIASLESGRHVFCEKPPGRSVEDLESVIVAEKANPKRKLKYGFNHRYHDSVRDALSLLKTEELGQLINMRGIYGKSKFISFGQKSDWRVHRNVAGGGILLDQGIHMVDLMRLFAGAEFQDVRSFVSNGFWKHDVEDNAYAIMRTKSGIVAMLHSTATQWRHKFELELTCARGGIVLSGILSGSKSYGSETMTIMWSGDNDQGDPREQMTTYNTDRSWRAEIDEFCDAVKNDRPIVNGSSDDALKTMKLVTDIYRADPDWAKQWGL